MKKYPKKRVLITGAGSGLGRALSLEFASRGWKVGIADINQEMGEETARLVKERGGEGIKFFCDVTKIEDLKMAAEKIKREWDGLDVLINNAGIAIGGPLEEVPLKQYERIINVNLKGVLLGCWAFIPLMKAQGAGHIINTASAAGFASLPEMSGYNVTKAGVLALTETLRSELSPYNIDISVIVPGFFRTHILNQAYFSNEMHHFQVEKLTRWSKSSAEEIARFTFNSIKKRKLYIVPSFPVRLFWKIKRIFPGIYFKILGMIYARYLK